MDSRFVGVGKVIEIDYSDGDGFTRGVIVFAHNLGAAEKRQVNRDRIERERGKLMPSNDNSVPTARGGKWLMSKKNSHNNSRRHQIKS